MQTDDIPYKDYDHADKMAQGFSFTIDRDGRWYCHDPAMGTGPIKRESLAKLFAGAGSGWMAGKGLSVDQDGRYWLKSPHDSYAIDVEDVPFLIVDFEQSGGTIRLKTNFNETVALDGIKTFTFRPWGPYPDIPYVEVRAGLMARLNRSVFYNLAELAIVQDGELLIESAHYPHKLGNAA